MITFPFATKPRTRLTVVLLVAAVATWFLVRTRSTAPLVEVYRQDVHLHDGLLRLKTDHSRPFTGVMVEKLTGGKLISQVPVQNGKVDGISKGWYANGQQEVEETFAAGISEGVRRRWHENGQLKSESTILHGKLHGPYKEWHDNGQLALSMILEDNRGQGTAEAWFPDGKLKSQSTLKDGSPVTTQFFNQPETTSSNP